MNKWQLQQRFLNTGSHLPKRARKMWDKYIEPIREYTGMGRAPSTYSFGSYCNTTVALSPYGKWHGRLLSGSNIHGNLEGEQYRWYMGHPVIASMFAQCRVCLAVCTTSVERVRHQKAQGCCSLLAAAIKRVKAFGLCIVCNDETTTEKWGLPLCSTLCEQLWKFEVCQPMALRTELLAVDAARQQEHATNK